MQIIFSRMDIMKVIGYVPKRYLYSSFLLINVENFKEIWATEC